MKLTFKTDFYGFIHSDNDTKMNDLTLTIDGIRLGYDLARAKHKALTKVLDCKVVYIGLPKNKLEDKGYNVVAGFLVESPITGNTFILTREFGHLTIENNDVAFTTEEEAKEFCNLHNELTEINYEVNYRLNRIKELEEELKREKGELNQAEESRSEILNRL